MPILRGTASGGSGPQPNKEAIDKEAIGTQVASPEAPKPEVNARENENDGSAAALGATPKSMARQTPSIPGNEPLQSKASESSAQGHVSGDRRIPTTPTETSVIEAVTRGLRADPMWGNSADFGEWEDVGLDVGICEQLEACD